MTIGEKIAEVLDWAGKTQQEVAEAVGVARTTMNGYINGKVAISIEMVYKIAHYLGVTPWTLLNNEVLPASKLDVTPAELDHITDLRGLTEDQRELVFETIKLLQRQNQKNQQKG